jgi:nicotinate-nucleotide adenylyltransferase
LPELGLFGGAFDPPHNGHVALLQAAKAALRLERVIVLVVADPGHKPVDTPAAARVEMARAAFPDDEVILDEHARTVDTLRAHPEWTGAVFLLGADQLAEFASWKEPDEILRRVRLGVAARPGYPPPALAGGRLLTFELAQPEASRDLRAVLDEGQVAPAVVAIIEREGLYGRPRGYTGRA